jgi:hypothetical protein
MAIEEELLHLGNEKIRRERKTKEWKNNKTRVFILHTFHFYSHPSYLDLTLPSHLRDGLLQVACCLAPSHVAKERVIVSRHGAIESPQFLGVRKLSGIFLKIRREKWRMEI